MINHFHQNYPISCVLDCRARLAEGPHWWVERELLIWVDILDSRVGLFNPQNGLNRFLDVDCHVGCAVPTNKGDLLLATSNGFQRLSVDTGVLTPLCDPESDLPFNRFNDGKCDPWGQFWAGTVHYDVLPNAASLWQLDSYLQPKKMFDQVTVSNGLAWSLDHQFLYFVDSPTCTVRQFSLTENGDLADCGHVCIQIPNEWNCVPDGITIDCEGMLWIALWDGFAVTRWDPRTGQHLATIHVPCPRVTSCCFGGDQLNHLFITTARYELDSSLLSQMPMSGGIFVATVDVPGKVASIFIDRDYQTDV